MSDPFDLMESLEVTDDPIFIVGPHKSGTSLLRNLFDGHEELFVLPVEMHFLVHAGFYIEYPYQKSDYDPSKQECFYENILKWIEKTEQNTDNFADSKTSGKWDLQLLRTLLVKAPRQDVSLRQKLDYAIKAIYLSLGLETIKKKIRLVEKSVENTELVPIYKKLFPNADFVHIVRNPYSNILSFRKYKTYKGTYPYLKPIAGAMLVHYRSMYHNRNYLDKFIVIRYEDLIVEPEVVLKKLAEELHLKYDKTLLIPTSIGQKWGGNSITGINYSGVSATNIDVWKEEINHFEISLVNKLFDGILHDFNYEKCQPRHHWALRVPKESTKIYFDNRIFYVGA